MGLDTNVILRVLLDDDPVQSALARQVFLELSPQRPGFITSVTLAEVYWNLSRRQGLTRADCLAVVRRLVETEALEFDDGEGVVRALESRRGRCRLSRRAHSRHLRTVQHRGGSDLRPQGVELSRLALTRLK